MEPAINLYSSNEKSELIRENSQEILSVLAAHQIALWEYDIITGKCSFSNDYFFTLGLKYQPPGSFTIVTHHPDSQMIFIQFEQLQIPVPIRTSVRP